MKCKCFSNHVGTVDDKGERRKDLPRRARNQRCGGDDTFGPKGIAISLDARCLKHRSQLSTEGIGLRGLIVFLLDPMTATYSGHRQVEGRTNVDLPAWDDPKAIRRLVLDRQALDVQRVVRSSKRGEYESMERLRCLGIIGRDRIIRDPCGFGDPEQC
jgi:hypothetical protein